MIIIGLPRTEEMDNYYMADGDTSFLLEQYGFHPKYMAEDDTYYFKLNKKLIKALAELKIDV